MAWRRQGGRVSFVQTEATLPGAGVPADGELPARARQAAEAAARQAGVTVCDVDDVTRLNEVARLFTAVWGRTADGPPLAGDLLRSLTHAGAGAAGAYERDGALAGACVAVWSGPGVAYSLIAAVRPGGADRGVGFALKQHQRAWALARGIAAISWTFDPLVGRNARFNLTKLGARATTYLKDFYGPMGDQINAGDVSDRLVVTWQLGDERVMACAERAATEPVEPAGTAAAVRRLGPDHEPVLVQAGGALWCRTPRDVVALRREDPARAAAWRRTVRDVLTDAFAAGLVATDVTRSGWYRLVPGSPA